MTSALWLFLLLLGLFTGSAHVWDNSNNKSRKAVKRVPAIERPVAIKPAQPLHPVPGPLPILGVGAALVFSRKLKARVNATR